MSFTFPNEIFSKNNISADAFGYYMLFQPDFLDDLIPSLKIAYEFPFFDFLGTPLFQLSDDELNNVLALVMKINDELQHLSSGRIKAVQMYLYLILLEAKRSYERQQLQLVSESSESQIIVARFRRLVGLHYLSKRQVSDYASMLSVSPNHLL
jgi:AraC family transcriptional regulator, transcriptional activator of pobA